MKKIILFPIFLIILPLAFAYTIMDNEVVSYSGGKSVLLTNGWRNSTTSDGLSYCNAYANSYIDCTSLTSHGVHHLFNQVSENSCLTLNQSVNGGASNFSVRYSFELSTFSIGLTQRIGISSLLTSSPIADMYVTIYANSTGQTKICLHSSASETCGYAETASLPAIFNIHLDFVTYEQVSAVPNISIANTTMWVNGDYKTTMNNVASPKTKSACLNTSMIYFRPYLTIYNLSVINYDAGEAFLNANASLNTSTFQCSDTLDNDNDTYFDLDDPQCSGATDNDESPVDLTQCSNSLDDDGDLLIDYPEDPSCDNATDYTEDVPDSSQCNDNNDNDGDGLIDYPEDPSCITPTSSTESPKQASLEFEDVCSATQNCVLKESFPYSDSIYLHNWTDATNNNLTDNVGGELKFRNLDDDGFTTTFNVIKNFKNSAGSYNDINGEITISIRDVPEIISPADTNNTFYITLSNQTHTHAVFKVVEYWTGTIDIYNLNYTNGTELIIHKPYIRAGEQWYVFQFRFDLINRKIISESTNYNAYSTSGVPTRIQFLTTLPDSADFNETLIPTYIKSIELLGDIPTNICNSYQKPYYIYDTFDLGNTLYCLWGGTNIQYSDSLVVTDDMGSVSIFHGLWETESRSYVTLKNQYTTIKFDANVDEYGTLTFYTFDNKNFDNIILSLGVVGSGFIFSTDSNDFKSFTPSQTHTYSFIIDIATDTFDGYIDSVKVYDDVNLLNNIDTEGVGGVQFVSQDSDYEIDNVLVYTSDVLGNPLTIAKPQVNKTMDCWLDLWCDYIAKCQEDDDCLTGRCVTATGNCLSINWNECEKEGYESLNGCMFGLTFSKSLEWFADVILDNFLMFIIVIILLMIIVYLVIMFRGNKR